jgi:heat shock protein HslJ
MFRYVCALAVIIPSCTDRFADLSRLEKHPWSLALDPAINLVYADGRIAGKTGCNQYAADVKLHKGNHISIGPVISTRRACLDEARARSEAQFLRLLEAVTAFDLRNGRLRLSALSSQKENGTLEFIPSAP